MTELTLHRLARLMAGAFLTLVALAVSSGGSARAACDRPHDSSSHFEHLIRAGAMPESHEASPPGKPPTCSGPQCSRGPAAPPSSSWTATPGPETWACLTEPLRPVALSASGLHPDSDLLLLEERATAIFHPPWCESV